MGIQVFCGVSRNVLNYYAIYRLVCFRNPSDPMGFVYFLNIFTHEILFQTKRKINCSNDFVIGEIAEHKDTLVYMAVTMCVQMH